MLGCRLNKLRLSETTARELCLRHTRPAAIPKRKRLDPTSHELISKSYLVRLDVRVCALLSDSWPRRPTDVRCSAGCCLEDRYDWTLLEG